MSVNVWVCSGRVCLCVRVVMGGRALCVCRGHPSWSCVDLVGLARGRGHASTSLDLPQPPTILNLPAAHSVQAPPAGPVEPALQVQSNRLLLASGNAVLDGHSWHTSESAQTAEEYHPALQFEHAPAPLAILNFPGTQAMQSPSLGPVDPGLQVHSIRLLLASGDVALDGHS